MSNMSKDIACIPITPDQQVGHGWGKAPTVAIAEIESGAILSWRVEDVGWDVLHDSGEGNHHARVVRFIQDNAVTVVVAQHMGEPMQNMLSKLGVRVELGAAGDARAAVLRFAAKSGLDRQDLLTQDVPVPRMSGQLLDHVSVDPAQGERPSSIV